MTAASPYLTLKEACAFLRHGRSYVMAHADEIGVLRMQGKLLFLEADLKAYADRHRKQAPALRVVAPPVKRQPKTTDRISPMTGRPYGVAR